MTIIGITGSIASGKSTVARLIAGNKHPLFNADKVVLDLYKDNKFLKLLMKKLKLKDKKKIKQQLKLLIKKNKKTLTILESIIHPFVRKKMNKFLKIKSEILILEIPLLIEKNLSKYFDKIVFIYTKKKLRLKRYLVRNNDKLFFEILDKRQLSPIIKQKSCDYVVKNNHSLAILKKSVKKFIKIYE